MSARVVLVDDHELVRAGIRSLLIEAGYEVAAEGSDGDQVEALVETHQPDVLLLDLTMRRCSGLEALARVRARWTELPVILLSMHDTRDYVLKAMQMGASGYLVKDAAVIELQLVLQSVLGGHRYLSPRVAGQVIDAASGRRSEDPLELLTSRQQEVLYWRQTSIYRALEMHILTQRNASRHVPEAEAVCGSSARTDLCGGWQVTAIPTATGDVGKRFTISLSCS